MNLNQQSRGFGDTIAKITHATGIDKAVETATNIFGIKDCGCKQRQELLNSLIPYSTNNQPEYGSESVVKNIDGKSVAIFD